MARISGTSSTGNYIPSTKLLSITKNPIGTLFTVWHNSRNKDEVDPEVIQTVYDTGAMHDISEYLCECYPEYIKNMDDASLSDKTRVIIREVVTLAIKCDVPASEFVSIELVTNDASVAWREQMVRNRKIHPWLQTSRTADLCTFDCNRLDSIERFGGKEAVAIYDSVVDRIREAYMILTEMGVPSEDIRLIPQGHLHRCMWGTNLRDLLKLVGKRVSWIAQSTLWNPVNSDIIEILRNEFGSDIINNFVGKCEDITYHKDDLGKVIIDSYKYDVETEDRYNGKDPQPCDPLWLAYTHRCMPEHTDLEFYDFMKSQYIKMWNDDILSVLEWERDNPDKIGPYDRPYGWFLDHNQLGMIEGLSHE